MAFKEVIDLACDTVVALGGKDKKTGKNNPNSIEGYYLGTKETETGKLHVFKTPKGQQGVWGKTDLDRRLPGVKLGTMTRVTFVGMVPTKKQPMFKYKIETDDGNSIDISSAETSSAEENEYSNDLSVEDNLDADLYSDESSEDTVPYSAPKAPATRAVVNGAKATHVSEILARRSSK